jgi:D-glycero-beta-D-manno-heptose-7-phosphate kinase
MANSIKDLLNKISTKKLLIWGDIMLDHYIWGDVNRISPEAPVPVVNVDHDTFVAGGAANVALNVRSLGAGVTLCGAIGTDASGDKIREILKSNDVFLSPHCLSKNTSTIVKTRVIVRNQQLCRLDRENAPAEYGLNEFLKDGSFDSLFKDISAVIISDYAKGVVTNSAIEAICAKAKSKGIIVAIDPKPAGKLEFSGIDLMTPNRNESLELAGIKLGLHDDYPAQEVCSSIWKKYKPKNLVITLGSGGMLLSTNGKVGKIIPTVAREVFDVSGAGDTVIAALTSALATGSSLEEAAQLANIAAGIVVAKLGTAVVHPEEIIRHTTES